MRKPNFYLFLALVVLASCVSNRKFLFLQKDDLHKKDLPKDSVVRSYNLQEFDYKIQTNDILSVRYQSLTAKEFDFLGQNQPSQQLQQNSGTATGTSSNSQGSPLLIGELVDDEGKIPIPVIGRIKVSGMTVFQAQDTIQELANHYLDSPIVKVRLLNYRVTILGEVNREGSITFGNNRVSVLEAIGLAGGLSDIADRANIKLIRQLGSKTEVSYINLLSEDYMKSPYYYIHQNDIIVVPPLRQRPFRRYFSQNVAIALSAVSVILFVLAYSKK